MEFVKIRLFLIVLLACVGLIFLSGLRGTVLAEDEIVVLGPTLDSDLLAYDVYLGGIAEWCSSGEVGSAPTGRYVNWQAPVNSGGVSVGGDALDGVLSADEELVFEVNFPEYTEAVDVYVAVAIPDIGGFFVTAEGSVVPFDGNIFVPYAVGFTRVPSLSFDPIPIYNPISGCILPSGEYRICSLVVPTGTDIFTWLFGDTSGELNCYSFRVECGPGPVEQGDETEEDTGGETGDEPAPGAGGIIEFADPNLEACVRRALGLGFTEPITVERARTLTWLDCGMRKITDLSGLEYFTGLERLKLPDNQISDISPLANLTNLVKLYLYNNQISDISPLANLTNLVWLALSENQISDISPLANLTNLVELYLYENQISDISPLANLTNLVALYLNRNRISDISPLANLTNLVWLNLSENQISDISPLANLTNLVWLALCDNPITDYSPIAGLNISDCYCCR